MEHWRHQSGPCERSVKLFAQVIANAAVEGNGGVEGFVDSEENSEISVNEEFSEEITEETFEEINEENTEA